MRRPSIGFVRLTLAVLTLSAATLAADTIPSEANERQRHDHKKAADTVFVNGKVLLYGKHDRWASAVAVAKDKISYVGNDRGALRLAGSKTRVVDLHGRTLMPGIGDGHVHSYFDVFCAHLPGRTVEEVLGFLKLCLQEPDHADLLHSNKLLVAGRFMIYPLLPGVRLTRADLDRLSAAPEDDPFGTGTTRPIVVRHVGGHSISTNSQAIINAGIDETTPDPPGGEIVRDENGVPTGEFTDFSADWGPAAPPRDELAYQSFVQDVAAANRVGITSFQHPGYDPGLLPVWKRVADAGLLTVRVNQGLMGQDLRGEDDPDAIRRFISGINDARRRFDGYKSPNSPGQLDVDTVKIFCDGAFQAHFGATASMLEPYNVNVGTPEAPVWVPGTNRGEDPSCDDSVAAFKALDRDRWSLYIHAVGDRATRVALDNFELARRANGRWDSRHVITHLCFVHPADMRRFGELGVVANLSLQWAGRSAVWVDHAEGHLNPSVLRTIMPARSLQRGGAVLAGGTDSSPPGSESPWHAIEVAITREHNPNRPWFVPIYPGKLLPSEALSRLDSLKMHTKGSAYQMHLNAGEIKKGKLADLIVIDRNPMTIPERQIGDTKVLMTVLGGKVVFDDPDTDI